MMIKLMNSVRLNCLIKPVFFQIAVYSVLFVSSLTSCIPNRKFVYLQKDDVNKKELPTDSVVRSYDLMEYEYRIQPEDIISVRFESLTPKDFDFFNQDKTSQSTNLNLASGNALLIGDLVDHNGDIPFPFLGKVKVSGMTIFEIQDKLQEISKQYLDHPVVKVRLINFRFTALGEVNKEGTITLQNNRVSLLEAVGLAGGMTDLADKKNIKLIRQKNGKTEIRYLNFLDEKFLQSPNYFVYQNDILVIPSLRQRPYRKYFGQNLALVISTLTLLLLSINFIQKK